MQGPRWGAALAVALIAILGWGLLVEWTIGPSAAPSSEPPSAGSPSPAPSGAPGETTDRPGRTHSERPPSGAGPREGAGRESRADPGPRTGAEAPTAEAGTPIGPEAGRAPVRWPPDGPVTGLAAPETPPERPRRDDDDGPRGVGDEGGTERASSEGGPGPDAAAPGVLAGRVEAGGAPVRAFYVSVAEAIGALQYAERAAQRFANEAGRFEFPGLAPAPYRVVVVADGHAPWVREVALAPGGAPTLEVELAPGGVLTGLVVREDDGRPIPNARVAAEGLSGLARGAQPHLGTTRTDAAGRFRLEGLGDAKVAVTVRADGFHSRISPEIEVLAGSVSGPLEIALAPRDEGEREKIELAGVGAVLTSVGDSLIVRNVAPDSGAAEVGIAPGDRILRINGREVTELGFEGSVRAIRGPEGTTVSLAILPQGSPPVVELSVRRGRVRV